MQDRYAGDVGDFSKLSLLRALADGRRLAVCWYLVPNELHNDDGARVRWERLNGRVHALYELQTRP